MDTFIQLTRSIGNVQMHEINVPLNEKIDRYTIVVKTHGVFKGIIMCAPDERLKKIILNNMMNGEKISEEEQELYIKEYMNIICGNGITKINNQLKAVSRLSVPMISNKRAEILLEKNGMQREVIWFSSDYGCMKVEIRYKFNV